MNETSSVASSESSESSDSSMYSMFAQFEQAFAEASPQSQSLSLSQSLPRLELESIEYGIGDQWVDVFPVIWRLAHSKDACFVFIPTDDNHRLAFFGVPDPAPGREKVLRINGGKHVFACEPYHVKDGEVQLQSHYLFVDLQQTEAITLGVFHTEPAIQGIKKLHRTVDFAGFDFSGELPEQVLIYSLLYGLGYANADANANADAASRPRPRVLEIGGNIGRASIVASSLLLDSFGPDGYDHVVFESDPNIAAALQEVQHANHHPFRSVCGTLNDASKYCLSQKGWVVSSATREIGDDDNAICSYTYAETVAKFLGGAHPNIWIVDCEGFFANILRQFPEILHEQQMQLLFLENDFASQEEKAFVDDALFRVAGMRRVIALPGGLIQSARLNFFEVWARPGSWCWEKVLRQVFGPVSSNDIFQYLLQQQQQQPMSNDTDNPASTTTCTRHEFPMLDQWKGSPDVQTQIQLKHNYEILGTPQCGRCSNLFEDCKYLLVHSLDPVLGLDSAAKCFSICKRDLSASLASNRHATFAALRDHHGFSIYDENDQGKKYSLPIVLYNGTYIGGVMQAAAHFHQTFEKEEEELEQINLT